MSVDDERISVKTVTMSGHVLSRKGTFHDVDRILVLRINVDDGEAAIEDVADGLASDFPGAAAA